MGPIKTILFFCLSLGLSSAYAGDTYQAPEFGLKERQLDHVEVKKNKWDSGLRFQVQENAYSDRSIASDENEQSPSRDPSSYEPLDLSFDTDVQEWRWEDIEHQP